MSHMSRQEYRMKREHQQNNAQHAKREYSRLRSANRQDFHEATRPKKRTNQIPDFRVNQTRQEYSHVRLNFWKIFSDRPYVSVLLIVLALFMIMIKWWWGLLLLAILIGIGIFVIGHSHHPNRVLSLEFKMKASRKLSMLRAVQLGCSVIMFLATYMRQVVTVDFQSAGSKDSLQIVEGLLSSSGNTYGQQGSYFLNLLNTLTGGSLFSSYRYATNSAQMMNSNSGRMIVMWILLLMIAPAFCVLAQFFKEPYSRNATLIASLIAMLSFLFTPHLMRQWVFQFGIENQMGQQASSNAVTVGPMAYVAIACSVIVAIIAFYRFVKKDNFK